MTAWHVRDFEPYDLEAAVQLDRVSSATRQAPIFTLADVVGCLNEHPAVVAVADGTVIGTAIGRVDADRAWILRLALSPDWRHRGLGSDLLAALEQRLLARGVSRLSALLPEGETGGTAFTNSGFAARHGITYYEKSESSSPAAALLLNELGAAVPNARLWAHIAGMSQEKDIIEHKLILPLARPDLAAEYAVDPPRAVILFGPPGTGKTTFAQATAGRLGWPFVELFPSRLAAESGLASGINNAFAQLARLDHAVVFIDEIEEIAAARSLATTDVGVVNELLKALVGFRQQPGRLFICATNSVRSLDAAFLRHGRFDYVLPVGPPDPPARQALWRNYIANGEPDLDAITEASEGFTPADIRHAAHRVAQQTFERAVETGMRQYATTGDYLATIAGTKPTLTDAMITDFAEDTASYART
jgi:GNAT superfamily N-acetyltransferase